MTGSEEAIIALSGGIGGAKLALGFYQTLAPGKLTVLCNTGDDFHHLGLHISPDIDTVLYTLAGVANPQVGWGRRDETWTFMSVLQTLGGPSWFSLGDGDLAMHLERTRRMAGGEPLSKVTAGFAQRLGVTASLLPMTDHFVPTVVRTAQGELGFQEYFVARGCEPMVTGFRFRNIAAAAPVPKLVELLADPHLAGIVICPSNPFISIDPMLAVPGLKDALNRSSAPLVAVSPLVAGKAVKGPTAKMMRELAMPVCPAAVASHYLTQGLQLDGFILDEADAARSDAMEELGLACGVSATLMATDARKRGLAQSVLELCRTLQHGARGG